MKMEDYIFIAIQDKTGDSKLKLQWDSKDKDAIEFAQEEFKRLQEAGYRIFEVKKVLGFIKTKGEEIKEYNSKDGMVYYEKNVDRGFSLKEVEADNIRYEEPKKFDPKKDKVTRKKSYVATKPLRAG
jgi:hypothetical protein